MMKLLKYPGMIILLYGIGFALMSNFNMGVFMVLALGAGLVLCGVFPEQIKRATSHGILKALKYAVIAGIVLMFGIIGFLAYQSSAGDVDYKEDAVIVLGAAVQGDRESSTLAARLDGAADYASRNEQAVIIVSGGQGPQENLTEAEAMENYLTAKGVPVERIIKEEKATSTYENFKYSKEILNDILGEEYTCAYVTSEFHCYRAGKIAEQAGLDAAGISVDTEWWKLPVNYMRESLAVVKFWVLGY